MNSVTIETEKKYWTNNYKYIAGVDEAGRGCLAGPLVCSAVLFKPHTSHIKEINDSKKLTSKQRESLFHMLCEKAYSISITVIDEKIIDKVNIYQATVLGMQYCIELLNPDPEVVLVDGMNIHFSKDIISKKIVKGDNKIMSIAAASIVAKVFRDRIMNNYSLQYPMYGFNNNFGYPTKLHKDTIKKYGVLSIHRKTYKPVKKYLIDNVRCSK